MATPEAENPKGLAGLSAACRQPAGVHVLTNLAYTPELQITN
jgi:hypothetical protein